MKSDLQALLSYKNELEMLVEEQTANISVNTKKIVTLEEAVRHRETDIDSKDGIIRRMTDTGNETKKKLM